MLNAPVQAAAEGLSVTCPIIPLAARLGAIRSRVLQLDRLETIARRSEDHLKLNYFEKAGLFASDEDVSLRDLIACTEASSLDGAAVQLVEAMSRVADIYGSIDERDAEVKQDYRAFDRLIYSALRVIIRHTGKSPDDIVGCEYVGWNCDPWDPVEDRVDAIRKGLSEEKHASEAAQ